MSDPLAPLPRNGFDFKAAQHLLNRAGFGGSPEQIRALAALGLDGAIARFFPRRSTGPTLAQLGREFRSNIQRSPTAAEEAELRKARATGDEATLDRFNGQHSAALRQDRDQFERLQAWWLKRILVDAENAFEEKMVLFWHGHFATGFRPILNSWYLIMQMDLFRREHAGSFERLVRGIVRDPAMLKYLDNDENVARRPNENLARELLELFTMGEGNGYTESDIKEGARALTGWTVRDNAPVFVRENHDAGQKTIFGQSGTHGSDAFVNMILRRPEPPRLIARKLYRFFVNDHPRPGPAAEAVINALALEIRKSGLQLKPVLEKLFRSAHFYAPANRLSVIKSPIQLLAQTVRSLGTPTRDPQMLQTFCDYMGQVLLQPPNVKGWEGGRTWCNTVTLMARQNVAIYLLTGMTTASGRRAGTEGYAPSALLGQILGGRPPATLHDGVHALADFVLGVAPDAPRVAVLVRHVEQNGGQLNDETVRGLLCLLSAFPEYQLC